MSDEPKKLDPNTRVTVGTAAWREFHSQTGAMPWQPAVAAPTEQEQRVAAGIAPVSWEAELAENPVGMSEAARRLMDRELGVEVARRRRVQAAQAQAERIKVTR